MENFGFFLFLLVKRLSKIFLIIIIINFGCYFGVVCCYFLVDMVERNWEEDKIRVCYVIFLSGKE